MRKTSVFPTGDVICLRGGRPSSLISSLRACATLLFLPPRPSPFCVSLLNGNKAHHGVKRERKHRPGSSPLQTSSASPPIRVKLPVSGRPPSQSALTCTACNLGLSSIFFASDQHDDGDSRLLVRVCSQLSIASHRQPSLTPVTQ